MREIRFVLENLTNVFSFRLEISSLKETRSYLHLEPYRKMMECCVWASICLMQFLSSRLSYAPLRASRFFKSVKFASAVNYTTN